MNTELVKTATGVITRAQQRGTVTPAGFAIALDAAQLLQSPEAAEQVWADALELGAVAVEEMQHTRDAEVNDLLGGLDGRTAVEHVTAHKAAALLRKMAGEGRAFPAPDRDRLAALLAHHADTLAVRLRAAAMPGAAKHLTAHADALTADEESVETSALLDDIITFPTPAPFRNGQPAPGTCGRARSTGQPCPDHPVVPSEVEQLRAELVKGAGANVAATGELRRLRARVAELEAELRIGSPWKCPACGKGNDRDVCVICETYRPEPDEESVACEPTEKAADAYPPSLPWAALMDREDLAGFLDELAASAITHASAETALGEVEATCGRWRVIAEAQHAHNTAPGPDGDEMPDGITRLIAPTQVLRDEAAGERS